MSLPVDPVQVPDNLFVSDRAGGRFKAEMFRPARPRPQGVGYDRYDIHFPFIQMVYVVGGVVWYAGSQVGVKVRSFTY